MACYHVRERRDGPSICHPHGTNQCSSPIWLTLWAFGLHVLGLLVDDFLFPPLFITHI
jgi:hypothetical protein